MVFHFVELAWEILIVMFTIHKNLASGPTESLQFHYGCTSVFHVLCEASIVCQTSKMAQEEVATYIVDFNASNKSLFQLAT